MNNSIQLIKSQQPYRADYIRFPLLCPICNKIQKKSRKYKSPYQLLYHLSTIHDTQDEILSNLKIEQVRNNVRSIIQSYSWGMFSFWIIINFLYSGVLSMSRFIRISDDFVPPFCICGEMIQGILGTAKFQCEKCLKTFGELQWVK